MALTGKEKRYERTGPLDKLEAIADVFGVTVAYLYGFTENRTENAHGILVSITKNYEVNLSKKYVEMLGEYDKKMYDEYEKRVVDYAKKLKELQDLEDSK